MLKRMWFNRRREFKPTGKQRWIVESKRLPYGLKDNAGFGSKRNLYVIGGIQAEKTQTDQILHATIDDSGELSDFVVSPNNLPHDLSSTGVIVYNDRIYLVGGWKESSPDRGARKTTMSAPINADGSLGEWHIETNQMAQGVNRATIVLIENYIWVMGGWTGLEPYMFSQYAKINNDGTLGNWVVESTRIPRAFYNAGSIYNNGFVYIMSEYELYRRPVNTPTSLGNWTSESYAANNHTYNRPRGTVVFNIAREYYYLGIEKMIGVNYANSEFILSKNQVDNITIDDMMEYPYSLPIPMSRCGYGVTDMKVFLVGGSTLDISDPSIEQTYPPIPTTGFDKVVTKYSDLPVYPPALPIQVPPGESINSCQFSPPLPWCFQEYDTSLVGTRYLVTEDEKNEGRWSIYQITNASRQYSYQVNSQSLPQIDSVWSPEPTTGVDVAVDTRDKLPRSLPSERVIPPGEDPMSCFISPAPPWCHNYIYDESMLGDQYLVRSDDSNSGKWVLYRASSHSNGNINWTVVSKSEETLVGSVMEFGNYVLSARLTHVDEIEMDTGVVFHGEVSSMQMITGDALATAVGITAGTSINSDVDWLHFTLEGTELYVAKKPIRHDMNFAQSINGINGTKTVSINGKTYKVRALKTSLGDTFLTNHVNYGGESTAYDNAGAWGSEWNRLMYPIHDGVHPNNKSPAIHSDSRTLPYGTFAQYSNADLQIGPDYTWGSSICLEGTGSSSSRVGRGLDGISHFRELRTANLKAAGWRPVLELIP